jgi:guanylate kinase
LSKPKRESTLFVVSAPSGTGKTTIIEAAIEGLKGVRRAVSHTTRPRRGDEMDGDSYYFVTPAQFQKLVDEEAFLEWADVYGHRYGTARAEYEKAQAGGYDLIKDVDIQGAATLRRQMPDAVSVFVLPPSYEELESRLRGRKNDAEAVILRRLTEAIDEVRHYREYDYVLVNDTVEECVKELRGVIRATRARIDRADAVAQSILKTFEDRNR